MSRLRLHQESLFVDHVGWLRAAVPDTNDSIISAASLIVGVAGLVAGAICLSWLSGASRRDRGQSGRRKHSARHRSRDILVRSGGGSHRWYRKTVQCDDLAIRRATTSGRSQHLNQGR